VSDGIKEGPPMAFTVSGLMYARRTVDLVIPWRVASPRSPTPFHRVASDELRQNNAASRRRTPESCLGKSSYLDFQLKKQHEVTDTLWRSAQKG
jgi:hypothetical protein